MYVFLAGAKAVSRSLSETILTHAPPLPPSPTPPQVPTFVVQSLVDPSGLNTCFKMPCHLSGDSGNGTCTASEVAAIQGYAASLQRSIITAQAQYGNRDGHFLTTCDQHEESWCVHLH
jgi:hypothetical protein